MKNWVLVLPELERVSVMHQTLSSRQKVVLQFKCDYGGDLDLLLIFNVEMLQRTFSLLVPGVQQSLLPSSCRSSSHQALMKASSTIESHFLKPRFTPPLCLRVFCLRMCRQSPYFRFFFCSKILPIQRPSFLFITASSF